MEHLYPAKTFARFYVADKIARMKVRTCDKEYDREANAEIRKIAKRLVQSGNRVMLREAEEKYFSEHPDEKKIFQQMLAYKAYKAAQKRMIKVSHA